MRSEKMHTTPGRQLLRKSVKAQKLGHTVALLLWAFACKMTGECKSDEDCPTPQTFCHFAENAKQGDKGLCVFTHSIHGFNPLEAARGATLLIQGSDFFAEPSKNIVTLNGVPAEVLAASSSELQVKVPQNLRCSGPVQVTIGERVATTTKAFTYVPTVTVSTLAGSTAGPANGTGTAAQFQNPTGIAIDAAGNLYVTDKGNHHIRKVTPEGVVSTLAGNALFDEGTGSLASFNAPDGVAIDTAGNLYVADKENHRIRKVTPEGVVSTLAGSTKGFVDDTGGAARFSQPVGIAIDAAGNLYVTEWGHRIRKVTPEGVVSTLAGSTLGSMDGVGTSAQFNTPSGVAIDTAGNLYVADYGNHRIRKVTPEGVVSTFAGRNTDGFADGSAENARFNAPLGIAADADGYFYVADTYNHRIRRISPEGAVRTLAGSTPGFADGIGSAAQFQYPVGITTDASGILYVADQSNHRIRKLLLE